MYMFLEGFENVLDMFLTFVADVFGIFTECSFPSIPGAFEYVGFRQQQLRCELVV